MCQLSDSKDSIRQREQTVSTGNNIVLKEQKPKITCCTLNFGVVC